MLKPIGLKLVCMGATDIEIDEAADYFETKMYWSHFNAETNVKIITECGFIFIWSKIITNSAFPKSSHLFVLECKNIL